MPRLQDSALTLSLYRISKLVGTATSPRDALETILDEVIGISGATSGSIGLIDPNDGRLQIEVHRRLPEDCRDAPLRIGEGVTGWVALHGEPLLVSDVSTDPRYRKVLDEVRSEMAAPIQDDGQVIGVIDVSSDQLHGFDNDRLHALTRLATETAAVLRQLWLVENLKTTAGHLGAVLSVGQSIASRLDQREILSNITRETLAMSGCRICTIHLLDPNGNVLISYSVAGGTSSREHPDLPVGETSAGVAVHRKKQVEVADVRLTEELKSLLEFAQSEDLASLLCTPIVFENKALGILCAYTWRTHRFSNDERNLFEAMAGLAAVAIQNTRLYERVFRSEETLRRREKLMTLGLIAAEIAHEIRNPLTVLKLLFQSLDLTFPPDDARNQDVAIIGEKLDQLEGAVGRVLAVARPAEEPHTLWSLENLISDTVQLLRLKCQQAGIAIHYHAAPDTPRVPGDKGQLQQVLLNLILNALQALDRGGSIDIRTGPEDREQLAGAFVEVADSGTGIPEALRADPFQSLLTGHAEGTGLGLGIVKRIVESHRGRVEVTHTGATGTTIKFWLPAEGS